MEVNKIIVECHKKAKEIISENKDDLERIAEYLIERETITGDEFMEILKNKENSDSNENAEDETTETNEEKGE